MTPVPPVPELAVTLAAVALHDAECPDRHCSGPALGAFYRQARIALEAASHAIRADEREAVLSMLLGCITCGEVHEPHDTEDDYGETVQSWFTDHPYRPRYRHALSEIDSDRGYGGIPELIRGAGK